MSHYVPADLFSVDTNPKTIKGQKFGFMTAVLYMAPADQSGHQVCPMAKIAQCEKACLYRAGRGAFNATQNARINKTKYFFEDQNTFILQIAREVSRLVVRAKNAGMTLLVRMNGTQDIKWENVPFTIPADFRRPQGGFFPQPGVYENIFAAFPDVQFYDYTKMPSRDASIKNYDLTFSYSGVPGYQKYVSQAIAQGMRIAVVFRHERDIPSKFLGMDCVPGDNSDIRHIEPQGVVVALYAKGPAKKDMSGFVVDVPARVIPLMVA
jgi:hypothetical protein